MDFKAVLQSVALVILILVSYAAFWVLVILLVGYVIYKVQVISKEDTEL